MIEKKLKDASGKKTTGKFPWSGDYLATIAVSALSLSLALNGGSRAFGEEPKKPDPSKLVAKKVEATPAGDAKPADAKGAAAAPAAPIDPNAPRPTIKPDEETHDFGSTWVGEILKHTFKIKNEGTVALEITKVQPGCGCTTVGQHPSKIEPGQSGEFSFSLNSSKLNGPYEKMITVTSNDPSNPQLKLKLKGEVKQYVSVVPSTANFGKVFGGESQERVLKITNNTEKPLELTLTEVPPNSKFKFELVPTEPGKAFDLKVSLPPSTEQGNLNTQVKLNTNVDGQKTIDINAIATIPPRLDLQPNEVTVAADPAGAKPNAAGLTRLLRFNNYGSTPVKVTEATCDDPEVKLTVTERQADKEYQIQVQLPPGYKVPDTGRMITLKTTDAEKPALTVPIKGPAKQPEKQLSPAEMMVGTDAPDFTLATTEGKAAGLKDLKNSVAVLNFFAPNCGFCKKQIPRIHTVMKEYKDKGVRFINVSEKMRKDFTQQEIVDILNESCKDIGGHSMELALDMENKVGPLFKANSFPTMVLLGKTGKVEAINSGNIGDLESKLKEQLDALLAGKSLPKPDPAKAAAAPQEKPRPATELIGKPAPKFALSTIDGKPLGDAEFGKGAATILNFVAPNCGFCKKQVPTLEAIRKEYEAKGIRFVNVVEKMGTKEFAQQEIVDVFKGVGSQLEMAIDAGNTVGQSYKAMSFPTMVIVDKKGNVDQVHVGAKADLESTLKTQLDNLIAGKSNATAAAPAPTPGTTPPAGESVKLTPVEVKDLPPALKDKVEKDKGKKDQ